MDVRVIYRDCPACGRRFGRPDDPGRKRRFCSMPASRPPTVPASAPGSRPANEPRTTPAASVRSRPAANATALAAPRRRMPGPAAPGPYCGSCGGHRGPHTLHRDQAAHDRARRRYNGRHAKAASTDFPEEADACRASRAAPGQVRSVGDDGRIVTRSSTEQGERYGSSATAATNGS
jgi:hypothetical protein